MKKKTDLEFRENCHFRAGKGKKDCAALNERACEECSFYKTSERFYYDHEKAMEQLHDNVSLGRLEEIRQKYQSTWKELMEV